MLKQRDLTVAEQRSLQRFKNDLEPLLGENLISLRLFGSRARREGTEESDLDVLVVLRRKDRATCRRIIEAALEIDLAFDANLAPTVLSAEEYEQNRELRTPFYRNVEHESLPL